MASRITALVAVAGLIAGSISTAARAAEPDTTRCRQSDLDDAPKSLAKQRLFERSADPATDRTPAILRATGNLAMKALAAPVQLTRWIKSKTDRASAEPSN